MDQYLLIPFLGGWTSIYQLFWCSPGVQGFDTLPLYIYIYTLYNQSGFWGLGVYCKWREPQWLNWEDDDSREPYSFVQTDMGSKVEGLQQAKDGIHPKHLVSNGYWIWTNVQELWIYISFTRSISQFSWGNDENPLDLVLRLSPETKPYRWMIPTEQRDLPLMVRGWSFFKWGIS